MCKINSFTHFNEILDHWKIMFATWCKTAVTPLLMHWSYNSVMQDCSDHIADTGITSVLH